MLKNGFCACVFALMISTVWSEEPTKAEKPTKQRVSPKILREAMALPEYRGQPPETPALILEDLDHLVEKLKKNGDTEGADLLQKFIAEHRRLVKKAEKTTASNGEILRIRVKLIEVNIEDLPNDSILLDPNPNENTKEIQSVLEHLVAAKKAKVVVEPVLEARSGESARLTNGGEFSVPVASTNGQLTFEFREFGTTLEVLPKIISKGRVQLLSTCEIAEKDTEHQVVLNGTSVPGISHTRFQGTFDANFGDTTIMASDHKHQKRRLFVLMKVNQSH